VGELDQHGTSGIVRTLNAALDGLLASPVEVVRLSPMAAGTADEGQL
jgi:hypothetical protein